MNKASKLFKWTSICLSAMIIAALFLFTGVKTEKYISQYNNLTSYYKSEQPQVVSTSALSTGYTYMSDLYTISGGTVTSTNRTVSGVVAINSAEDLYAFSRLANSSSSFMGYDYEILANIDYQSYYIRTSNAFYPVGYNNTTFTGTFNGNGYEVKGLKLFEINSTNQGTYDTAAFKYYSMFSQNSGTISNLGLVEPNMVINTTTTLQGLSDGGISPLVGLNSGTVEYCFVRDLRDPVEDEAGITAMGGYNISGFAVKNTGTMNNNYVAYSIVSNYTVTDYLFFTEMLITNEGTFNNNYFVNKSISEYSKTASTTTITYTSIIGKNYELTAHYGTYVTKESVLSDTLAALPGTKWKTASNYGSFSGAIGIVTPITRGVAYDDETKTFTIENVKDYIYMYELFKKSPVFAGPNARYLITKDINLENVPTSLYSYNRNISATIEGLENSETQTSTLVNNTKSKYPTIYNATVTNTVMTEGIEAYGVFPHLTGTVKNLNIAIPSGVSLNLTASANIKAIGVVSGYVDGGEIENVNVFADITLNDNCGKYFVGGACGILGNNGSVSRVTTSGANSRLNVTAASSSSITNPNGYAEGNVIGGVVGYIADTYGSVNNALSTYQITAGLGNTAANYQIGGVIGAGYTAGAYNLENVGAITTSSTNYRELYVAGVMGRHLGVKSRVYNFNNQGDITVPCSSNTTYVAGVINATIQTRSGSYLSASSHRVSGKYVYYAGAFTNRSNVTVSGSTRTVEYTHVMNLLGDSYITELSSLYNLNYREIYQYGSIQTAKLDDINIDMAKFYTYAPVLNVKGTTKDFGVKTLSKVYNLRDINLTTSENITASELKYTGCVRGSFINYNDVRNEGNMTVTIRNNLGTDSSSTKLLIAGVMEEVSSGYSATTIYNGGNIPVTYSADIYGDIIVSGIAIKNLNGYTSQQLAAFNPLSSSYNSKATGTLNNVINNGDIYVDTSDLQYGVWGNYNVIQSANGQSNLGSCYVSTYNGHKINGNVYVSGIVFNNQSVITNTFNLGDLSAYNFISERTATKEINVSGIVSRNIGLAAYILNSANNGTIKAVNMSSGTDVNTPYLSNVNAAGIVARNDQNENGTNYSGGTSNSSQIISFTINYGDVYSYNYAYNLTSTSDEPKAKSAGIIAMGLCSAINVVNYGNIYGSETASGIFGILYFNRFASELASSKVNIANTINYGNVYMLSRGYNNTHGNQYLDYQVISYSRLKELTSANVVKESATLGNVEAFTTVARNTDYLSVIGSVFSIVNFASNANANNINIRYLISFTDEIGLVGSTTAVPSSVTADVSTLYSAHSIINAKTGATQTDQWMGKFVQYAPLITGKATGKFVTNIDGQGKVTTANLTYPGVFNTDFKFRLATRGIGLDAAYASDSFLADYFQFVGYKYINDTLLDKIGWRSIAYSTAANDFAQSMSNVLKVLDKSSQATNFVTEALKTDNWMQYASQDVLSDIIDSLIETTDLSGLTAVLEYVFSSESSSNVLITTELREAILTKVLSSYTGGDLASLLQDILTYKNGYSQELADAILTNDDEVKAYIESYVGSLDAATLTDIITSYINYLEVNNNSYFTYGSNETARLNILNTLFANINDNSFYVELNNMLGTTSAVASDTAKMYGGYQSLTQAEKLTLFTNIVDNSINNYAKISTYLDSMEGEIGYFAQLVSKGINATSKEALYSTADLNSGSTTSSGSVVDNRIALWNQVKDTNVFKTYVTNLLNSTYYFKATEFNNTFQSVTEPHNDGAYVGDTTENRLSYLYATNVTPAVYFYGPYTAASNTFRLGNGSTSVNTNDNTISGSGMSGYSSIFHAESDALFTSNTNMPSRGGASSTTTFNQALNTSILMYYDLANEQLGEAGTNRTYNGVTFKGFYQDLLNRSKNLADPMNNIVYNTSDWSGVQFGATDATMTVQATGETFSLNNAKMSGIYYSGGGTRTLANGTNVTVPDLRIYIQDENGTWHPVYGTRITYGGVVTTDFATNTQTVYSYLAYLYGVKYYTATATTSLHSTGRTGIYRFAQPWGNHSQYFTWKQSNSNKVYTSQYIDYKARDILNLDGFLTQYDDGTTQSADEREIINTIFNTYFLTSGNYQTFRNVVRAALLESLGLDPTTGAAYIDSFVKANIYSDALVGGKSPFEYLNYNGSTTVKAFLSARAASGSADEKSKLIMSAASDKDVYVKLLKALIEIKAIEANNDYLAYIDFLTYLRNNPGAISGDSVLLNALSGLSTADLETYLNPFITNSMDIDITRAYDITGTSMVGVYSPATYDGEALNYGLTFATMTLKPSATNTRVILIAASKDGSQTLSYTAGSNSGSVEVSGINAYTFETSGATTVTISSDNNIVLYSVYFITDETNTEVATINETLSSVTSVTLTEEAVMNAINASIEAKIGTGSYYKVTEYTVSADYTITSVASNAGDVFLSTADRVAYEDVIIASKTTVAGNSTAHMIYDVTSYVDAPLYFVCWTNLDPAYRVNTARAVTAAAYTITYKFVSEGHKVNQTTSTTTDTESLYSTSSTSATYTSGSTNVNAAQTTIPSEATIKSACATRSGVTADAITIDSATITYVLRNTTGSARDCDIATTSNNTANSRILKINIPKSSSGGTVNASFDLKAYMGQTIYLFRDPRTYTEAANYYFGSYTYTVNYSVVTENKTTSFTMLSQADAFQIVRDNEGVTTNNGITINSVTAAVGVYNHTAATANMYLIVNGNVVGQRSVNAGQTAIININNAQNYYGQTVQVRTLSGAAYVENANLVMYSRAYTVNYSVNRYDAIEPVVAVTNDTIYRNRLLNAVLPAYSVIRNRYEATIYNNSTNINTLHTNYLRDVAINFTPMNVSGNDVSPINPVVDSMSSSQKAELARLLVKNYNVSLYNFIKATCTTKELVGDVLNVLSSSDNGYNYISDAIKYANTNGLLTNEFKNTLVAAYIIANYINVYESSGNVYNTEMRRLLDSIPADYRYINSNGTFDNDKFDALLVYLGIATSDSGYGLYALASSEGIKNGTFIPDNIVLAQMDATYINATANTANSTWTTNIIKLTADDEESAYWRNENGSNPKNDISNRDSVNYHVLVEMKQLKKSISTTIFEADIEYDENTTLYSSESTIDLDNYTITYYVPADYLEVLNDKSNIVINKYVLANSAELVTNSGLSTETSNTISFKTGNGTYRLKDNTSVSYKTTYVEAESLVIENAFVVYAEETTVYHLYTVIFEAMDISFEIAYDAASEATDGAPNSATVASTGGNIVINVTSPVDPEKNKLPERLDLKQFIYLVKVESGVETGDPISENVFEFSDIEDNAVIDASGNAVITMDILSGLSAGEYHLYVDIYSTSSTGMKDYVVLVKEASTECSIETLIFEGVDYSDSFVLDGSQYVLTNLIEYGRAYNYADLLDYSYLDELVYSDNATVDITVTKTSPAANETMTYTVTYLITAESGDTKTYVHKLQERKPFATYTNGVEQPTAYSFVTVYEDGSSLGSYTYDAESAQAMVLTILDPQGNIVAVVKNININASNEVVSATATNAPGNVNYTVEVGAGGRSFTVKNGGSVICHLTDIIVSDSKIIAANVYDSTTEDIRYTMVAKDENNNIYVSFPRGEEPQYRIKFILSNFYTDGDDIKYSYNSSYDGESENGIYTVDVVEASGLIVSIADASDAGSYTSSYIYKNTGAWDDGDYERVYNFPSLVVVKTYSNSALIEKITFLDSYKIIGNTATVILPNTSMIPTEFRYFTKSGDTYTLAKTYSGSTYYNVTADIVSVTSSTYSDYYVFDTNTQTFSKATSYGGYVYYQLNAVEATLTEAEFNNYIRTLEGNEIVYSSVFQENYTKPITIDGTSSIINYGNYEESDDFYTVGTIANADISYYAPTFVINEYAQIYQYTTVNKVTNYGYTQTVSDADILGDHSDTLLYVPFYSGDNDTAMTQKVMLVSIDNAGHWKNVYDSKNWTGTPLATYSQAVDTYTAKTALGDITIDGTLYHVSSYAGSTSTTNNSALYMDYIGTPLDNHFWYVSYIVFSESYLRNTPTGDVANNGGVKHYHVSLIDTTNNIYFDVEIDTPTDYALNSVYMTITENIYSKQSGESDVTKRNIQISAYARKQTAGVYKLEYNLQVLPAGYFYFYVDIPGGYVATYEIVTPGKSNQLSGSPYESENEGAYVAPSSIVTQKIGLKITIAPGTDEDDSSWGLKTSDSYSALVTAA